MQIPHISGVRPILYYFRSTKTLNLTTRNGNYRVAQPIFTQKKYERLYGTRMSILYIMGGKIYKVSGDISGARASFHSHWVSDLSSFTLSY